MNLPRVLEPEVMDTVAEARDYDSMDHAGVNQAFVTDLLACGDVRGDVLDLGTGTALIPIALCERTETVRVMAVDLAVHMLDLARLNVETASLIERIELRHIDAKALPFPDQMFDVVMSNSIVHHIPEPAGVIADAVRVCRPGGRLFFRDLLRPDDQATLDQLVQTYAGEENAHQRKMFADSLHAALRLEEMRQLVAAAGFDPGTVQQSTDRHWTWSAVRPA